jgi:hypothetical protein
MPRHSVGLKIAHEIAIANVDIEVPVKKDGAAFGRVKISKGGIDWKPPSRAAAKKLSWTQFAELMAEHGHR